MQETKPHQQRKRARFVVPSRSDPLLRNFTELVGGPMGKYSSPGKISPGPFTVERVLITLTVFAVKAGHVDLAYTGSAVSPFSVEAVVSPGVELETVEQDADAASVTVRVSELPRVRGIVRVLLLEYGAPVETQSDPPSPFTAVHCHDFLNMDGPAVAEKIAYCLGESFPEGYEASVSGDTVTVKKTDASAPVELELAVQEWVKLESD